MADVSAVRYFAKRARRCRQSGLDVLKFSHAESLRQNSASRKVVERKDFSEPARQNPVVHPIYRKLLRDNVRVLMEHHQCTPETIKARYLGGAKCGRYVSARSLRNVLNVEASAPGIDVIAAVAARFALEPWQLLCPIKNPRDPPRLALREDELRLVRHYEWLKRQFGPPGNDDGDDNEPPIAA